ncbi:hypothetical protein [Methylophilus aquaticus]|uniref:Glycosaminoglycan attachment site n=1 Tax=Methylophilus aquaticus TaxID=1971610 RepID=A0ABT9JNY6_9PROT|nr:hypothetical protein [Methylophilus aquaticus]MDP8566301.1 hypothetical protein [Methylophilus aquaticus]
MDLFTPVVDEARLHQNFISILLDGREPMRAELARWAEGFQDRDGKFVKEFQTTFNSSFWEIYLFAVFKEYGFDVDWSNQSPDFNLIADGLRVNVEAVTANAAQGKPNEWERTFETLMAKPNLNELNRESIIRLSNAILGKARKYNDYYSKLAHVARHPFVIAIAPFEQPLFNLQYNRPIKALLYDYYVDEEAFMANPSKYPNGPPVKSLGFIEKDNGSEIELGIFNSNAYSEVSAIIFSCTASWGKVDAMCHEPDSKMVINSMWGSEPHGEPVQKTSYKHEYTELITDGLQIYHNPFAKFPLPLGVFRRKGVVQVYPDHETFELKEEEATRSLFYRMVNNFVAR